MLEIPYLQGLNKYAEKCPVMDTIWKKNFIHIAGGLDTGLQPSGTM